MLPVVYWTLLIVFDIIAAIVGWVLFPTLAALFVMAAIFLAFVQTAYFVFND